MLYDNLSSQYWEVTGTWVLAEVKFAVGLSDTLMVLASEKCGKCMVNSAEYKFLAGGNRLGKGYHRKYMKIFGETCGSDEKGRIGGSMGEVLKERSCQKFSKQTFGGKIFSGF